MSTFNTIRPSYSDKDLMQAGAAVLSDDQLGSIFGGDGSGSSSNSSKVCVSAFGHELFCVSVSSDSHAEASGNATATSGGDK
jgi:hypothetical protein